jgi:L-glyceraldehyde 3-phosphate reductase
MTYLPNPTRYEKMVYRRLGRSGLKLPTVSLGLWHNFGDGATLENCRQMVLGGFDLGVTHFDLANNYGPPAGAAEKMFGKILTDDLTSYRDELIVSTKAGYDMWPGPYGDFGSRKYLLASLDQSLKRMKLDYVDIFYHHRPDPETPLEETMGALDHAVKSGRALYVGLSNYEAEEMRAAAAILADLNTPFVVNQVRYHMFDRQIEERLIPTAEEVGIGLAIFSPLAQGLLTDRYLHGIPPGSRAGSASIFLSREDITEKKREKVRRLNEIAQARGQGMAELALAFVLRHESVSSVIVGASSLRQIEVCCGVLDNSNLTSSEIDAIDDILE